EKPTIIIFKTTIGIGTAKEGTSSVHGAVLSQEELKKFNEQLEVFENFYVPNDVRDWCMSTTRRGKDAHEQWNHELAVYANSNPELYRQFSTFFDKTKLDIEKLARSAYKWEGLSGRELNNIILNELSKKLNQLVGGNGDVEHSTRCKLENAGYFSAGNKRGRNIHFGVREHAMAGICNGIALYEDFCPYAATALTFSSYMLPAIKMAAMMKLKVLYLLTHDSIHIGQDGASHQPIEQLANLRSIIGLNVFRPCDGRELLAAYQAYFEEQAPTAILLSKQPMPEVNGKFGDALMGGYVISPAEDEVEVVLYASGSEVSLAISVAAHLKKKGHDASVVSMPCLEIFEQQTATYKDKVLQKKAKLRVAIEASNDAIWYKYVGDNGMVVGVKGYQGSGDGAEVYKAAGFDDKEIARAILKKLVK
ncbi:MAG: transketolase, partial [Clostridia bacterium]|nr:transketolase [Clostridia bacterium]